MAWAIVLTGSSREPVLMTSSPCDAETKMHSASTPSEPSQLASVY
jgi:hypothetical protein